jgi:hypothetical protein
MSFFDDLDPPPAPPEPVEHRTPPWAGPAPHVLPASVALDVVLARTPDWAAWIGAGAVTPDGLAFDVTVLARVARPGDDDPVQLSGSGPDDPRFGVGFADGRRAFGDQWTHGGRIAGDAATEVALRSRGGSGRPHRWTQDFWLWPLPPEGPLTFAFAWPAQGLAEAVVAVDSAPIRAAAARAVELWPDERPERPASAGGGWLDYA